MSSWHYFFYRSVIFQSISLSSFFWLDCFGGDGSLYYGLSSVSLMQEFVISQEWQVSLSLVLGLFLSVSSIEACFSTYQGSLAILLILCMLIYSSIIVSNCDAFLVSQSFYSAFCSFFQDLVFCDSFSFWLFYFTSCYRIQKYSLRFWERSFQTCWSRSWVCSIERNLQLVWLFLQSICFQSYLKTSIYLLLLLSGNKLLLAYKLFVSSISPPSINFLGLSSTDPSSFLFALEKI